VEAHFRLHRLTLRGGDEVLGFVRGTVGETMILVDPAGTERRVARGEIRADEELPVSPMPPNFADLLPPGDLDDLVAWLAGR
jgi:hypothetical protein